MEWFKKRKEKRLAELLAAIDELKSKKLSNKEMLEKLLSLKYKEQEIVKAFQINKEQEVKKMTEQEEDFEEEEELEEEEQPIEEKPKKGKKEVSKQKVEENPLELVLNNLNSRLQAVEAKLFRIQSA